MTAYKNALEEEKEPEPVSNCNSVAILITPTAKNKSKKCMKVEEIPAGEELTVEFVDKKRKVTVTQPFVEQNSQKMRLLCSNVE